MNTKEKIVEILSEVCEHSIALSELDNSLDIISDFGIASLSLVTLIIAFENEFNMKIDILSLDIESFKTLDKMVSYINKCQ